MPPVHILDMSYIIWQPNCYTLRKNLRFTTKIALRTLLQNTVGLGFVGVLDMDRFITFVRQRPFKHWTCFRMYLAVE